WPRPSPPSIRPRTGRSPRSVSGTRPTWRRSSTRCSPSRGRSATSSVSKPVRPSSNVFRGPPSRAACSSRSSSVPRVGDAQRLTPDEQIRSAHQAFESGRDFTLAVEEEFALLDPTTLSLVNRFEELQAAAQGGELEECLVGELIASEVEVRTGRCETF